MTGKNEEALSVKFDLLFLGTGVSSAVPSMSHILNDFSGIGKYQENMEIENTDTGKTNSTEEDNKCKVCYHAWKIPGSKNKRNNVSVAIISHEFNRDNDNENDKIKAKEKEKEVKVPIDNNSIKQSRIEREDIDETMDRRRNDAIVIDAGKTFRESILTNFPPNHIQSISSLLLTHDHADAIFGLDDLRDLQPKIKLGSGYRVLNGPMHVFLSEETYQSVEKQFPYLTHSPPYLDKSIHHIQRNVALLEFNKIKAFVPFYLEGIEFIPLPLHHGGEYICFGYLIGKKVLYFSDLHAIPDETLDYLVGHQLVPKSAQNFNKAKNEIKPHETQSSQDSDMLDKVTETININTQTNNRNHESITLILDCLHLEPHFSHLSWEQCYEIINQLQPEASYLVGMGCAIGDHDDFNKFIEETIRKDETYYYRYRNIDSLNSQCPEFPNSKEDGNGIEIGIGIGKKSKNLVNIQLAYDGLKLNF